MKKKKKTHQVVTLTRETCVQRDPCLEGLALADKLGWPFRISTDPEENLDLAFRITNVSHLGLLSWLEDEILHEIRSQYLIVEEDVLAPTDPWERLQVFDMSVTAQVLAALADLYLCSAVGRRKKGVW